MPEQLFLYVSHISFIPGPRNERVFYKAFMIQAMVKYSIASCFDERFSSNNPLSVSPELLFMILLQSNLRHFTKLSLPGAYLHW